MKYFSSDKEISKEQFDLFEKMTLGGITDYVNRNNPFQDPGVKEIFETFDIKAEHILIKLLDVENIRPWTTTACFYVKT